MQTRVERIQVGHVEASSKVQTPEILLTGSSPSRIKLHDNTNDVLSSISMQDADFIFEPDINNPSNFTVIKNNPENLTDRSIAYNSVVVHKNNVNETVSGVKTFVSRPIVNGTGVFLAGETILASQISNSTSAGRALLTGSVQFQRESLSLFPAYSNYADLVINGPQQSSRIYVTTDNWRTYAWVPTRSAYIEASPSNLFINSIINSDFSLTGGLTQIDSTWYSGVPTGWSGSNNTYTIQNQDGNFIPNIARLGSGPSGNSFRQNLGILPITSDVKLTFTFLNAFPAFGTPHLNAAIYDSNYKNLATGLYTNTGTYTLTGTAVKGGTNVIVGFWAAQNNPGLDNVFIENTVNTIAALQDVDSLSGASVLTYGNQNISGNKTFQNNIGVSGTGIFDALDLNNIDNLSLSGVDVTIQNATVDLGNSQLINAVPQFINETTNFFISGNDNGRIILANSATQITGTIVSGNTTGFNTSIIQIGAGQIQITGAGAGVVISSYNNQFRTAGAFATISLLHTGNNRYIMHGNTI